MTTDAYLWAIFALLFLALVLVVVIARRGPWEREQTMKPCLPIACPDQEEVVIEGIYTVIEFEEGVIERAQARWEAVFPTGVDPLWGKNRP